MKDYGGSERSEYRGDETCYIVIYYGVLFVYSFIYLFFVFVYIYIYIYVCVCVCSDFY